VQAFLDSILGEERQAPRRSFTFTLTTAIPAETGSLHGWRTLKLRIPGRSVLVTSVYMHDEFLPSSFQNPARLARLTVEMGGSIASVTTCNVACFSIDVNQLEVRRLDIDGCTLSIPDISAGVPQLYFERDSGGWRVSFHLPISRQRASLLRENLTKCTMTTADPHHGRVTTGSTALYESIFDLAFYGTAQDRRIWRFGLLDVDRTATRERPVHVPQVGRRYRPRD
jgi:hypothetical protein